MTQPAKQQRNKLIGAIHASASAKGIDDDTRRALMLRVVGKDSCSKMTKGQLIKVLDEMNGDKRPKKRRNTITDRQKYLEAIWINAAATGVVKNGSSQALDAYVARQMKNEVTSLSSLSDPDAGHVIECLKKYCCRVFNDDEMFRVPGDHSVAYLFTRKVMQTLIAFETFHTSSLYTYSHRVARKGLGEDLTPAEWTRVTKALVKKLPDDWQQRLKAYDEAEAEKPYPQLSRRFSV